MVSSPTCLPTYHFLSHTKCLLCLVLYEHNKAWTRCAEPARGRFYRRTAFLWWVVGHKLRPRVHSMLYGSRCESELTWHYNDYYRITVSKKMFLFG